MTRSFYLVAALTSRPNDCLVGRVCFFLVKQKEMSQNTSLHDFFVLLCLYKKFPMKKPNNNSFYLHSNRRRIICFWKVFGIIILISTFLPSLIYGQEYKTKKKKENTPEGTAYYNVLATNDSIKHGTYMIKAYSGNRVLLEGNYALNKKVGLWNEQYYGKYYAGPKATGNYKDDIKIGKWCYFDYNGDTAQIYDWSGDSIVYFKSCGNDKKEYFVIENGNEIKTQLDCPPTCIGGLHYFLYEFKNKIGDYSIFFNNTGNGLCELNTNIGITVDSKSSVIDISYTTEEKNELKEIIEKYIKSYQWFAGKKDGANVTAKIYFSIRLSIQ
jgi:hypothetical protein